MHAAVTRLRGPLDIDALTTAVNAVVRRHETLRTRFEIGDGVLTQVIEPVLEIDVPVVSVESHDPAMREADALGLVARLSDEPIDIDSEPVLRASIVRLAPDDHFLVLVVHHISSDGWSMGLLARDLSAAYSDVLDGGDGELGDLPIQYADFAAWQRDYLSGERLEREVAYWRDRLAGSPSLLELPTDRPRPAVQSFDGSSVEFDVPPHTATSLRSMGSRDGATLFMVLLAAFDALIFKCTGQPDVLVATPIAGRTRSEAEDLIGFFVNTLVLRADLDGDPTFEDLVAQIRDVALDAYTHQELPFEKLVEELNPQRDLSHLPLAQVMFVLQNAPDDDMLLRGVEASRVELPVDMAPYDVTLEMRERDGELEGSVIYNTDLFDRATAEQLARHFRTLLVRVAEDPLRPLSVVEILEDDERDAVLHGWYEDRPELMPGHLIHETIADVAAATPDRTAALFEGDAVTYGQLNARANQLAHYLRSRGIGREHVVGVMFEKSIEMLVALVGVWKAGAAFVPLDSGVPAERCSRMLEETGTRLVLTLERLRSAAEAVHVDGSPVETVCVDTDRSAEGYPITDPEWASDPHGLAYVIFTSGSTGAPKGVMMQYGGLVNMAGFAVETYNVHPDSRFLQFMSITFDAFLSEILPVLSTGATLVLGRRERLLPGGELLSFLKEQRITNVLLTPSALAVMPFEELPDLHTLIVCGEACPPELVTRWGRGRKFVNAYGPTEITCFCHAAEVTDDGGVPPIGRPLANTRSYVLDSNLLPVPLNVRGELYVGTVGLARGYANRPDLTAERFLPDPFAPFPGARMYRTGDVVRCRRDGQLEFLGRFDSQVKLRGFRVEPGEIEAVLLEHPGVADAVVIVDDDQGEKRLVAYFASRGAALGAADLRSFAARKLPSYMLPPAFVPVAAVPLLPSGKVDRKALPEPPSGRSDLAANYVAPSTPTEETVSGLWHRLLKATKLGVEDKFFDVGGNSLKIVELYEGLNGSYPGALSAAELFEHTTIREMAAVIDERLGTSPVASAVAGFEL
jgi:amino acid adenylation domain-containing protein